MLRRALDLRIALKLGVRMDLDEIRVDEFLALVALEEQQERLDRERLNASRP
ncbi:MAG TPA: hypothetical protein PK157_21105 [Bryobacteraceae bacterium]|nr:hypothetical protein [Bryobacteraceae bacterium]